MADQRDPGEPTAPVEPAAANEPGGPPAKKAARKRAPAKAGAPEKAPAKKAPAKKARAEKAPTEEAPAAAGEEAPAAAGEKAPAKKVARKRAPTTAGAEAPATPVGAKAPAATRATAAKRAGGGAGDEPSAGAAAALHTHGHLHGHPFDDSHRYDVLVVGGGPAGSSCAYWLAAAGWDVAVAERKRFPRAKTCGDGLTPRAVRQLADMGLEDAIAGGGFRYGGLRSCGFGRSIEMAWPRHPVFPDYGYTITRHDLDGLVAGHAASAGATVWQATEVTDLAVASPSAGPRGTAGTNGSPQRLPTVTGATILDKASGAARHVQARYVVVADGANSRIGRSLGSHRERSYPLGMALRGYYRSPRHDDPFIESHLDIRDAAGDVVPGYGWIFPLGDGRVNVGVGVLSSESRWRGVNTTRLMEAFVQWAPESWELHERTSCGPPTGGKLPMGMSVVPKVGDNCLLIGDAGGSINPFNGEGIAYGYETGRMAAAAVGEALAGGGAGALEQYQQWLDDGYGPYFKVARAFVKLISDPAVMRLCVSAGMRSEWLMLQLLRIMGNLMRPDSLGGAEVAYLAMETVARRAPRALGRRFMQAVAG